MKVLCIGDSLTAGYIDCNHGHAPYTDHLGQLLDKSVAITNAGVDGETVSEIKQRLGPLLRDHYDVVVFLGGTNDLGEMDPSSETVEMAVSHSFTEIYSLILGSPTTKVLIQLTIPFNAFDRMDSQYRKQKEVLNEWILQIKCPKKTVLDINDPALGFNYLHMTEQDREMYFQDSLHYTAKGYQRMAECVFSVLNPILASLK